MTNETFSENYWGPEFGREPGGRPKGEPLLAITVRQPYAHAIIHGSPKKSFGIKTVENRSYEPPPRLMWKRFAIHASSSSLPANNGEWLRLGIDPAEVAYGSIIGTVRLISWFRTSDGMGLMYPGCNYRDYGLPKKCWTQGPYCWVLAEPEPCRPIRHKGQTRVWVARGVAP